MASAQLFDAVPFFAGLTLDEIGGRGVCWPASEAAAALGATPWQLAELAVPPVAGKGRRGTKGALRLGTWRSLWASPEVDLSPALRFMRPQQIVELAPVDADRLGVRDGDQVEVGGDGTHVRGVARLRASVPGGSVFLVEGTHEQPANVLTEPLVHVRPVGRDAEQAAATAAVATPAGEGHAEAPASAPLNIPPTQRSSA
jgi:NADH-quinone oxidoreductase subunit G